MIMATNRPDTLDPALLRPGRLDRKIDWEAVVKLSDGFNGADLRNVCTEADISNTLIVPPSMFAIRAERDYTVEEDFMKAVRKINDAKKLETKLDYKPV
ncbi:unnamed protein product [Echinostoma caproni]|uniref:AAA_lid_3 domain-containing protein n=1 Tax=Echinostoma caproni TaxID=27848 RepID=A0A183AQ57_9TREM|nr:unnamed protein product [Echinostoma caproni]